MSSRKLAGRRSLFADVSFADLWRAARYRQRGGEVRLPASLDLAHASRFAAQSQPLTADAGADEQQRALDAQQPRQAA